MTGIASYPLFALLGEILFHSLWQGALIAALLLAVRRLLAGTPASYRYAASWLALVALVAVPVATVLIAWQGPALSEGGVEAAARAAAAPAGAIAADIALVSPSASAAAAGLLHTMERAFPLAAMLWMIGVCVMGIRLCHGWVAVRRLRLLAALPPDAWLTEAFRRLAARMGVDGTLRVTAAPGLDEPVQIGWLKPVILLPASLLTNLAPSHVEAILAHELAHIRRHDYLLAVAQSLIDVLLFYHPAAWWISHTLREEREQCCDDLAVATLADRKTYVHALASLALQRPPRPTGRLALGVRGSGLAARIARLVSPPARYRMPSSTSVAFSLALIVVAGGLVAACAEHTVPGEPLSIDTAGLPEALADHLRQNDIEGTITYLHERRETGDPAAYDLAVAAYHAARNTDLRQNLVFVFAHFNTLESDRQLIQIADTDDDAQVRKNAIRAIGLRTPRIHPTTHGVNSSPGEPFMDLTAYPAMTDEQLAAVRPALRRITGDNAHPARRSALYAMAYHGDETAFLGELLARSTDFDLKTDAVVMLGAAEDQGRLLRDLYHTWNGEGLGRLFLLNRLTFSAPSMDGVELLLEAARSDSEVHFESEYVFVAGYLERFPAHLRPGVVARLEEEKGTFPAGSQAVTALQKTIDGLR